MFVDFESFQALGGFLLLQVSVSGCFRENNAFGLGIMPKMHYFDENGTELHGFRSFHPIPALIGCHAKAICSRFETGSPSLCVLVTLD